MASNELLVLKKEAIEKIELKISAGQNLQKEGYKIFSKGKYPKWVNNRFCRRFKQWKNLTKSELNRIYNSRYYSSEFEDSLTGKDNLVDSSWKPDLVYYLTKHIPDKLDYLKMLLEDMDSFREVTAPTVEIPPDKISKKKLDVKKMELDKMSLLQVFNNLTMGAIMTIISILIALFVLGYSIGNWIAKAESTIKYNSLYNEKIEIEETYKNQIDSLQIEKNNLYKPYDLPPVSASPSDPIIDK